MVEKDSKKSDGESNRKNYLEKYIQTITNEEFFKRLFEDSPLAISITDLHGTYLEVNDFFCKMLGYTEKEIIGKKYTDFSDPIFAEHSKPITSKLRNGEISHFKTEYQYFRKDKSVIFTECSISVGKDNNGNPLYIIIMEDDISSERKIRKALENGEREKTIILESLTDHVIYYESLDMKIVWANSAAVASTNFKTSNDLIGKKCHKIWHKSEKPCDFCPVIKAYNTLNEHECEVTTPDGRIFLVKGLPVIDEELGLVGVVEVTKEITFQKNAEKELKEREKKYKMLFEYAPDIVCLINSEGVIVDCNQTTTYFVGKPKDEIIGISILETKAIEKDDLEEYGRIFAEVFSDSTKLDPVKIRVKNMLQEQRTLEVYPRIIYTEREGLLQIIAHDITDKELYQEARKEFITKTNHELRTPLTVCKGYVELLKAKGTEFVNSEKYEGIISILQNNLNRLEELISGVSDLYNLERGKFEIQLMNFDIKESLINSIDSFIKLYGSQITINDFTKTDHIIISGDPSRLDSVFYNVIENALHHTNDDIRHIEVNLYLKQNNIEINIIDNGAGIKEEDLKRIFKKFVSIETKYKVTGTGIGLFLSREIITAHNGTIVALSKGLDKGTTIKIKLPIIY